MNLPLEWVREFCDIKDIDAKKFSDEMTLSGSKVEGYETVGGEITNIVVGKITEITKHPDADKLQICRVNVGGESDLQIVTAATNVFVGALVPVCLDGAHLADGTVIKKGKLRGVVSEGMFCSIEELGLTINDMPYAVEDGILILDSEKGEYPLGADVMDALGARDTVVEFEITPNRPDCLSVIGLAREAGATFGKKVKYHTPVIKNEDKNDKIENYISVKVDDGDLCKRYTARVVKNVKIAPSPRWLRMRLRAAGVRPINNIVDITNYVMLEYGQPMHAFDYACLDGKQIVVRRANEGEIFKSLDDKEHVLKSSMLVIADAKKAVALAGVMGGANSEIKDGTKTVVFESANFDGASVRITSRALGMRTESSGRFEKGLDSDMTKAALERACELVEMLGAGEVVSGQTDIYPNPKKQRSVALDCDKINHFLGVSLSKEQMVKILESLEFEIKDDKILVPSYRDDVECMNDIAEEVIRIYGYNTIESTLFYSKIKEGMLTPKQKFVKGIHSVLCSLGMYETYTFSFISPKYYDKIMLDAADKRRKNVVISNPLGEDTSVMRTTALPSMLEVIARNESFGNAVCDFYETATVYLPNEDKTKLPFENLQIVAASLCKKNDDRAFFRLKGKMDALLDFANIKAEYVPTSREPYFHPGRQADVTVEGRKIATIGQIHPSVCENYGISGTCCAVEIDGEALFELRKNAAKQYTPLPKFPASTRDLALVCDEKTTVGEIENVMREAGGKLLEDIRFFDVYRSEALGKDKKSLAFSLVLRAKDKTLTDEDVDRPMAKILKALEEKFGAYLRK